MLIEKLKHHKNISSNIQINQLSPTPLADELAPVTEPEASCNNTATELRHLLCKLHMRWYTDKRQRQQHSGTGTTRSTSMWSLSSIIVVLGVILMPLPPQCDAVGYSYTRFSGPVSGPEHRVYIRDRAAEGQRGDYRADDGDDEAARLDYVAKPEYEFAYGVEDAQAQILHNRNEMRDGDAVKGVYSVVDPDGTLRVVKYTADDINGFQAEVIMNGISAIHGQLQQDTPTTITHPNVNKNNNNRESYNHYPQTTMNVYSPEGNLNYNQHYHPSYYYPTSAHYGNPSATVQNSNNNQGTNNDYDDNQDYNNESDYRPQYEVHEPPRNDEEDDKQDGDDEYDGKEGNKKVSNGGKKKDYDDDDTDGDGDEDGDDYDDSEELENYDEAVKSHETSNESDEYY